MTGMSRKNRMKCAEATSGHQRMLDHATFWPQLCVLAKEWLEADFDEEDDMTSDQLRAKLQEYVDNIADSFVD